MVFVLEWIPSFVDRLRVLFFVFIHSDTDDSLINNVSESQGRWASVSVTAYVKIKTAPFAISLNI